MISAEIRVGDGVARVTVYGHDCEPPRRFPSTGDRDYWTMACPAYALAAVARRFGDFTATEVRCHKGRAEVWSVGVTPDGLGVARAEHGQEDMAAYKRALSKESRL